MSEPSRLMLEPAENIALTVARAQLERGENPPINTTAALVLTIERLAGEVPSEVLKTAARRVVDSWLTKDFQPALHALEHLTCGEVSADA